VEKPQTFRSPTAVVIWIVWLLFAVANWVDLAVQGRDHLSLVAAAVLLLATGVAYVTAQRPRIVADDAGVTVRNPLRDHRIGWAGVTEVDLLDLLRVHCAWGAPGGQQSKVISAWAVPYSRRRQLAVEAKARRAARSPGRRPPLGFPSGGRYGAPVPAAGASTAEADAEKILRVLSDRATAARAEAIWAASPAEIAGAEAAGETAPAAETGPAGAAGGTTAVAAEGWTEPLTSTWSGRAIAALVIPALILLVVFLL
jgi:Bacterial PH domain